MSQNQDPQRFWSIERSVTFVIAPIVTPLSGALALWLARHFPGVHVTGDAIAAFAATVAGGTASGFVMWLRGRQKSLPAVLQGVEAQVGGVWNEVPAHDREGLLQDIEGIVAHHLGKLAEKLSGQSQGLAAGEPLESDQAWNTPNDPAPETPPEPTAPPPGVPPPAPPAAADAGAAVVGS